MRVGGSTFTLALLVSAPLMGCGANGRPVRTATSPGGVTEQQRAPRPGPSAPPGTEEAAARLTPFQANILQAARNNDAYRRVLFTGARTQLVVMAIPPGGDIGMEMHPHVEQLIFIESGQGKAVMNGAQSPLARGDVLVVTPGTRHDVINTGAEPLRIYTVYAPPNHIDGRVQQTKADAEADKADEAFGASVR